MPPIYNSPDTPTGTGCRRRRGYKSRYWRWASPPIYHEARARSVPRCPSAEGAGYGPLRRAVAVQQLTLRADLPPPHLQAFRDHSFRAHDDEPHQLRQSQSADRQPQDDFVPQRRRDVENGNAMRLGLVQKVRRRALCYPRHNTSVPPLSSGT